MTAYDDAVRAATDLTVQALADHRLGSATQPPWYLRKPPASRMPKDFEQTYRCKCGWQGTHAAHETHRAEVIARFIVTAAWPHITEVSRVGRRERSSRPRERRYRRPHRPQREAGGPAVMDLSVETT